MGTIAKSSITLTSISDAYSVALTPSSCVIHADFDGSNPQLTRAYTLISIFCGDIKVPISVNTAAIEKSDAGIGYSIVKVDDYNYKLSITSLATSILEGYIEVPVLTGVDLVLPARFPFTVVRESSMLDWIQEWESNKTTLGDSYVITPKIFVGKKITGSYDNLAAVPGLTGVYIGPSANDSCGVYGYKNSIEIFHLDETGGKIGGWDILEGGIYSTDGRLKILSDGHIKAVNAEGDSIWEINSDGSASFAIGNVRFYANGNAEFKGKITSSEGKIGGWTINDIALYNLQIGLNSAKKHIAIANITTMPVTTSNTWDGDHITWVKAYGGVAMYYTSNVDYGFIGYKGSTKVFSAGSSNYIAGWNFDDSAIWLGTKNNNVNQYTAAVGDVTLGTNGLRGYTWYINTDGTASFVKGYVQFNQTSGLIAGWTFDQYRLSTKYASLVSQDGYSGLYLSIADTSAVGTGSLASNIQTNGGLYLQATSTDVVLASYNSSGSLQFKVTKTSGLIAGWTFDPTAIYTGTKVTSGFTSVSGSMTLGADGLRGYKWRFEKDGSGALSGGNITWANDGSGKIANGKIAWDKDGNLTFDSSVTMMWENGINVAQMIAFGQMLYRDPEFTQDKKNGTTLYQNNYIDYVTFSANLLLSTLQNYGLHLRGQAVIQRIDVISSNGGVSTIWSGSQGLSLITAVALKDAMSTITSTDTIRISFQMEDAQIQIGVMSAANTYTSWINLCGYTSNSGTAVIHTKRVLVTDTSAPNSTQKVVQYTCTRWNAVGDYRLGGFCFFNPSRANAKFVVKIVAKIPVGWMIENYHNSYGTGASTTWVTSQEGTGSYAEYICIVKCGSSGTFSTINHFSLKCNSTYTAVAATDAYSLNIKRTNVNTGVTQTLVSVVWNVAYATVFDATSSDKVTTTIDKNGIYTGTLRADQIVAGTIDATKISADIILSNGNAWALNKDGSGYLANKNITWDANGNTSFSGKIIATSGTIGDWSIVDGVITSNTTSNYIKLDAVNMCITAQAAATYGSYDMNSSFGAILSMQASNGVIQAQAKNAPSYSTAVSYMSSNGIFSNIAGINGMPSSSGYTHRGAVVGLGFANVNKSIWDVNSEQTIVAGVYGRASNNGTAPAYGGFFYNLFAGGMVLGRKCVTGTSNSTVYLNQSETLIIGYTSATATVYLPTSPEEGQIVLFKQWWTGKMRVYPRSGQTLYDDSTANDYYDVTQGEMLVAIFTIGYITSNNTTTKVEAWLVSKFKY